MKNKRKTSILNYLTEQSETKAENCVYLSEVLLLIQLSTMIIRDKSPPLFPSRYATLINRNDNQKHLIGYTWIETNSQILQVTVCESIYKYTSLC